MVSKKTRKRSKVSKRVLKMWNDPETVWGKNRELEAFWGDLSSGKSVVIIYKDKTHKYVNLPSIKSKKYIIDLPHEDSSQDTAAEGFMTEQAPNEILILSLDEAIMKIDLEGLSALIFTNVENHKLNFIYYKKNGKIALIDIDG